MVNLLDCKNHSHHPAESSVVKTAKKVSSEEKEIAVCQWYGTYVNTGG